MASIWNEVQARREERLDALRKKSTFYYDSLNEDATKSETSSEADRKVTDDAKSVKVFDNNELAGLVFPKEVRKYALQMKSQLDELEKRTEKSIKNHIQKKILQQD